MKMIADRKQKTKFSIEVFFERDFYSVENVIYFGKLLCYLFHEIIL